MPMGREVTAMKRKRFGSNKKDAVIVLCIQKGSEQPCGAYDESFVPQDNAINLVSEWEILLRRTTIYLCAWAEGIVSPKVLRKYIGKGNREWIRLYRYMWLKSQTNHLGVFLSPKSFALTTCVDCTADRDIRTQAYDQTLPPARTKDSFQFTGIKGESAVIMSDLPLMWRASTSKNITGLSSCTFDWG